MTAAQINLSGRIFTLRMSIRSDIPVLSSIIDSVFSEYNWIFVEADELPDFVDFDTYYADESRARLFTVVAEGSPHKIIGCIALKFNAEGPYLSRVYLLEEYRGYGLGKWMTTQVMESARRAGFNRIHLWTDTRFVGAHHMYRKLGFTMTGEIRSLHDINNSFEYKMAMLL